MSFLSHIGHRRALRQLVLSLPILLISLTIASVAVAAAQIEPFVGTYSGSAEVVRSDGSKQKRDLSVAISQNDDGFVVQWTTKTFWPDGRVNEKSYDIQFIPSPRDGLYAAAQKKNLFGKSVQLDPMKGEPYVWGQISGDTLTVYALFVDPVGGYVMHQYDRTLADGGLALEFNSVANGDRQHSVTSFLKAE
jgi:hypothetical protein